MNLTDPHFRRLGLTALTVLVVAACSGGTSTPGTADGTSAPASGVTADAIPGAATSAAAGGPVLPVPGNPITNTATAEGLKITQVLVENNEDPKTKKTVDDHLEIALENTSPSGLSGFQVYYTFTDRKTKATEGYAADLGPGFTIAPGASRVVHFDLTGASDHFPDNKFSIYRTSKNALDVTVQVSADGVGVADASVKKDAGGPENPDE